MVTQSVSELVSQLITQSEDRIYFVIKKKQKIPKSLLQVSDCRYNVFIVYPKILDFLQLCSSRKFHTPSPHRGQFCFRPLPPWNFHSRGCLSLPPPTPWNSYSVKIAVAPYYCPRDNCLCDKTAKKLFIHVNISV